ncbi:MAG: 2-C-methyl-D-erythritol 2,4-cyclodiphosphate synthase, partial [Deltaproteobacteria bacterium]|nr:2-C-methyl-D-erythritol 2,4-cyclodiphosphate synthase [Deltaproteobacteria bacterium]
YKFNNDDDLKNFAISLARVARHHELEGFILSDYRIAVLLHALMDALLGCVGGGDIGQLFPDADPALDNVSSCVLLDEVMTLAREKGFSLEHVDVTVIAQRPKVGPHREEIRKNLARLLGLGVESVNVKATTEEGLGFTGSCQGIKSVAVATGRQTRG